MTQGAFYILFGQAAFLLAGYIIHALLGRSLGPELYGVFGVLMSIIFIVERLLLGSISKGITKFVAEKEEIGRSVINYAMKIQFIFSFIVFLIFYVGAGKIAELMGDANLTVYLRLLSILIIISAFHFVYFAALNGLRAFGKQAIILVLFSFSRLLFVVLLVLAGYSLKGALWGLVLAAVVCLMTVRVFCKPLAGKGDFNKKALISYSLKVTAFTFGMLLIMNIDLLSVKIIMKDAMSPGLYTVALTLARIPTLIAFPLSIVLFPMIAKSVSDNNQELATKHVNRTLRYVVLFSVPLAFMVSATSQELITFIYGSVYAEAAPALTILIFALTFITVTIVMNTIILAACRLGIVIFFNFFLVFLDIVLNVLLIKKYGIFGASLATTLTAFAGCAFSLGYVFRSFSLTIRWNTFANILLSSVAVYFIAYHYAWKGILLFPCYLLLYVVYFMFLFILREFNVQDMNILKDMPIVGQAITKRIG